jgi:GH15 family glucan-1,4-alpha-glucosidase
MPLRIEDYALIGDCETAALVGKDGSIDWLPLPRFDSPACFSALLGNEEQGRWLIAPKQGIRSVVRRYRDGTLVLETDFEAEGGRVRLVDFMALDGDTTRVVRIVEGLEGVVELRMVLTIRFDYGWIVPWVRRMDNGLSAVAGPDSLYLTTDVPVRGKGFHSWAEFSVHAGQRVPFVLSWQLSHLPWRGLAHDADAMLADTERFWRDWSSRSTYAGAARDAVVRSLITLKALTYARTGGIVAAPTTSLPEKIGGARNWDYRFSWLRDATFALYALLVGGYKEEARAWREWLVRAVAGRPEELQTMYGVAGERRLPETELPWLSGYLGSKPVRTGNAAALQHQLDVYGEVMDALHLARRHGLEQGENTWRIQRALMDFLERDWTRPDDGIWEVRGPPQQFTHSKVMSWVAVDRSIKAVEQFGAKGPVDRWKKLRSEIHHDVCVRGFDPAQNSFVQSYGSKHLDASLLSLPLVGFLPATDPRVVGTMEAVRKRLSVDGFILRYATESGIDGLEAHEGPFLICTFWMVDNLVLSGRREEALELFERLLATRNDVGLLSEQYDPGSGRFLGNFPQAFSHVALVNSARNLSRSGGPAEDRSRTGRHGSEGQGEAGR